MRAAVAALTETQYGLTSSQSRGAHSARRGPTGASAMIRRVRACASGSPVVTLAPQVEASAATRLLLSGHSRVPQTLERTQAYEELLREKQGKGEEATSSQAIAHARW